MKNKPSLTETAKLLQEYFKYNQGISFGNGDSTNPLKSNEAHLKNMESLSFLGAIKKFHNSFLPNGNQLNYFIKYKLTARIIKLLCSILTIIIAFLSDATSLLDFFSFLFNK